MAVAERLEPVCECKDEIAEGGSCIMKGLGLSAIYIQHKVFQKTRSKFRNHDAGDIRPHGVKMGELG